MAREDPGGLDDDPWRMDHSIKLVFRDESEILFFADSEPEKRVWIDCLSKTIGQTALKAPPAWAVALLKLHKP